MSFQRIIKFRKISGVFAASLALVASGTVWAYFALRGITQPLILHYTAGGGINQVGKLSDLARLGGMAVIMLGVNFLLALSLESRGVWWGKVIAVVSLIVATLIFIGFAAIISVN